jgi:hypothetical protein
MKYIVSINNGDMLKVVKLVNDATFTKTIEQDSDEVFFREKLDSPIRLKGADYDFVYDRFFPSHLEEKMLVNIKQVYLAGGIEKEIDYYNGYFTRVDCEFDNDNKVVEINVTTDDIYEDLLAGVDDEYDIIKMEVPTKRVQYIKRPILQIYKYGANRIGNFLGGTYWEQDCEPTTNGNYLFNIYKFSNKDNAFNVNLSGEGIPIAVAGDYSGNVKPTVDSFGVLFSGVLTKKDSTDYYIIIELRAGGATVFLRKISVYTFLDEKLFEGEKGIDSFSDQSNQTLLPILGSGASYTYIASLSVQSIYCRWLHDKDGDAGSYNRPINDITEYNTNYQYVKPYGLSAVNVTNRISLTPTKYGKVIDSDTEYYNTPIMYHNSPRFLPVSRSTWENYSIWFRFNSEYAINEELIRKDIILKDAYTIEAIIQALLNKILGEGVVKFEGTPDYSEFFYSTAPTPFRPLQKDIFYPLITPKSNILKGEYDKPAQKGVITLREVFDMLRNVFNCYWRLDNVGGEIRLRIEHIHYFENGGSYLDINTIGIDLTQERDIKSKRYYAIAIANYISGKHFPINSNKWKYNKKDLPTRIEYAFMDNCSEAFNGYPIIVNSPNVTKGKIDKIQSAKFTPDIDMMVSTPEEFNNDGFALLGATKIVSPDFEYILPIINININNMNLFLQNGYLAYVKLHADYFKYNCPATNVTINETETQAISTIKTKEQEVEFPNQRDIDYKKNIKSGLGVGTITKINVNLSNRKNIVTLKFND